MVVELPITCHQRASPVTHSSQWVGELRKKEWQHVCSVNMSTSICLNTNLILVFKRICCCFMLFYHSNVYVQLG